MGVDSTRSHRVRRHFDMDAKAKALFRQRAAQRAAVNKSSSAARPAKTQKISETASAPGGGARREALAPRVEYSAAARTIHADLDPADAHDGVALDVRVRVGVAEAVVRVVHVGRAAVDASCPRADLYRLCCTAPLYEILRAPP